MIIAGDPSGDLLASELVAALRAQAPTQLAQQADAAQPLQTALAPRFFGAGGPKLAAAGVEQVFDLAQHSVIGFTEVLKNLGKFRRLFAELLAVAVARQPDIIIGVDYGGFNLRFARAIRTYCRQRQNIFNNWQPKLVQFVSPQVWASRASRAYTLADNHDLLLSIFPFEPAWYAQRVPQLRVAYVGHPMIGRSCQVPSPKSQPAPRTVVLLPGSRVDEVRRHWRITVGAFELMRKQLPELTGIMVLPTAALAEFGRTQPLSPGLSLQVGNLAETLAAAELAVTKSGTVTMECAMHKVPAVVFYKTSWPTYFIGKQLVTVQYLAMPNLIAGEEIYPEFVQQAATPERIAAAGLQFLRDPAYRQSVQAKLARVVDSLGPPGAANRAATAILSLLP